jgi:hypothetical protein
MPFVANVETWPSGVTRLIRLPAILDWKKLPLESNALPDAPVNPSAHTDTVPSGVMRWIRVPGGPSSVAPKSAWYYTTLRVDIHSAAAGLDHGGERFSRGACGAT